MTAARSPPGTSERIKAAGEVQAAVAEHPEQHAVRPRGPRDRDAPIGLGLGVVEPLGAVRKHRRRGSTSVEPALLDSDVGDEIGLRRGASGTRARRGGGAARRRRQSEGAQPNALVPSQPVRLLIPRPDPAPVLPASLASPAVPSERRVEFQAARSTPSAHLGCAIRPVDEQRPRGGHCWWRKPRGGLKRPEIRPSEPDPVRTGVGKARAIDPLERAALHRIRLDRPRGQSARRKEAIP